MSVPRTKSQQQNGGDIHVPSCNDKLRRGFTTNQKERRRSTTLPTILILSFCLLFLSQIAEASYTSGLQMFYPMNESAGTTMIDYAGHFNATTTGTVSIVTAPWGGYARNFTGAAGETADPAPSSMFNVSTQITIIAWVNNTVAFTNSGIDRRTIDARIDPDTSWYLWTDNTGTTNYERYQFAVKNATAEGSATCNISAVIGTTYMVAATYDGANIKVYLNGTLCANTAKIGAIKQTNEIFNVGWDGVGATGSRTANRLKGQMGYLMLYNESKNQTEITALYNNGVPISPYSIGTDTVPTLTLVSPNNNTHVNTNTTYLVNITTPSAANCTLLLNGTIQASGTNYTTGTVNLSTTTTDGIYLWQMNCTNNIGSSISSNWTIIYDSVNPVWTVRSVTNGTAKNKALPYVFNDTISDNNLYGWNVTITNNTGEVVYSNQTTNLSSTSATFNATVNMSAWPDGNYTVIFYGEDDHTAASIPSYSTTKDVQTNELLYETDKRQHITVKLKSADLNISGFNTTKGTDRYYFTYAFTGTNQTTHTYVFKLTSDKPIYLRSKYAFPSFVTGKHWVDFNAAGDSNYSVKYIEASQSWEITVKTKQTVLQFSSLGGLNNATQTLWYILYTQTPPTAPAINVPQNTTYANAINIDWNASTFTYATLVSYNLTLLNPDNTSNVSIGTTTSDSYNYVTNLIGQFRVKINVTDSNGDSNASVSDIFTLGQSFNESTQGNYIMGTATAAALLNPGAASGTGLNWSALYHNMTAAKFLSGNVTRVVGGDLYVPWMDSSTACGVANLKTYGTHTASNFTDGYLQVSDEHSILLYNLGTGKNDEGMWNITQSLAHMTVGRGQLPGWICVINESTSNVNCSKTGVNSNNDTASDATARYILGLYAAYVNTNYTNTTRKAYYLSLANNLTRDMVLYEMVTPTNSNGTSCHNNTLGWGGNICYWIKGGSAANLNGTDGVYTGYFGEVIDALFQCYLRSGNATCLAAARNITLNYLQASYPSATPMTSFRVPPGKAFKWTFTANDSIPTCTNTCSPDYWDSVDAPRATSLCRASYHADQYNVTLSPLLDDYCLNWSNAKAGNLTSWMYQYYGNGSNAANAVSGFWSQGLEAQLLLGVHNATAVNASLTSCAGHYVPATGRWDSTSCTGIYEQQMCMNSLSVAIGLDYYPPEGNTNESSGSDTSSGTWRTRIIDFTGDANTSSSTAQIGTDLSFGQSTTYYTTANPVRLGFGDGLRNTLETAEEWCDETYGTNATLYSKENAYGYEYVWQYSGGVWTQTGGSHVYGITSITCSVPTTNASKNTYITNDLAIFGGVASGILSLRMNDGTATDVNMSYSCGEAAWVSIANNTQFTCNNIDVRIKAVLTNATTNTPSISNLTLNYTAYKNAYFKFLYNNTDTELWPICYEASTGNYLPVSDGDYYSLSSSINETLLCEPTDGSAAHQPFNVSVTANDGFYNETINVATYALTLTFDKATNGSIYWTDYDENLTENFDIPTLQYVKLKASLPADLVSIRFNLQGNYSRQYYMFQNNPGTATTDTVHVLDSLNTYVRFDVRDYGNGIISGATIRITQPNTTNSPVVQQIITDSISGGYDGGPVYLDFTAINTITVTKDGYATWQRTLDAAGFEDYTNTGKPITVKLKPISAVTGSAWLLACDAEYTTQTSLSCLVSSRGATRVHYATDYRPTESIQNFQNGGAAITLTQGRDYLAATNFTVTLTDDDGTVVASQTIHYNPEAHKSIMAGLLASYSDTTKTAITAFLWAMLILFAGFIGSTLITQSGADTGYYWFGGGTVLFAALIPTLIPVAAIFVVTMIGDAIKNAYQD